MGLRDSSEERYESLDNVVQHVLPKRQALLDLAARHAHPFFVFDGETCREALSDFRKAFDAHIPCHRPFYAVKANRYERLLRCAVEVGFGLDVSSADELELALACGERRYSSLGLGNCTVIWRLLPCTLSWSSLIWIVAGN